MSPITILLNIGKFISLAKDLEKGFADLLAGKLSKQDSLAVLDDVKKLLSLVSIPGVSADQIAAVISDVEAAL